MAVEPLILAADPGSASRKYALFNKKYQLVASLHFEFENGLIVCSVKSEKINTKLNLNFNSLEEAPKHIEQILKGFGVFNEAELVCIGLRTVAPTSYFLQDRLLDEKTEKALESLELRVPLHIKATLQEAKCLKESFKTTPIVLVSDSAFHITKPDYALNYAIPLEDADKYEIKRFGYHGISVASIVRDLADGNMLPDKLVVCHLGSGASITAVNCGQSVDNTMGYTPLEGVMMSTRTGNIDVGAVLAIKKQLDLSDRELENYLNKTSGLLGVSGVSDDIRELLELETKGDYRAGLAMSMYIYRIRQSIGQMAASLEGTDGLVFTGTVGCRSHVVRRRIVDGLGFLGFAIDDKLNEIAVEPSSPEKVNLRTRQKLIFVMTTDEQLEISRRAFKFVKAKPVL